MAPQNVLLKFTFEDAEAIDDEQPGWLLSSFYQNGQLIDYFHIPAINANTLIYTGAIIQPDSLDSKYCTPTAKGWLQNFPEQYGVEYEFEITGQIPSNVVTDWRHVPAFILTYGGFSPVRTLDTFSNVPLYLLPKTSGENCADIVNWQHIYESIRTLWWKGAVDEKYFYDQLTSYNSSLSQHSMKLCEQIAGVTNKACYFHLFRDMNPDVPNFENCPKCNGPWKLPEELFDTYLYQCDNCYLIS